MNWRKALFDASPWLTTIGLFVLWEVVCRLFKIPSFILAVHACEEGPCVSAV